MLELTHDNESLAQRVEPVYPDLARMLRQKPTKTYRFHTPFFHHGAIYTVVYWTGRHAVVFTVGLGGDEFTAMLAKQPENFFQLATHAGLMLDSDASRIAYVEAFLEATRNQNERLAVLDNFNEIKLLNNPRPEQAERYKALQEKYGSMIQPPEISQDGGSWLVRLFALHGQNLVLMKAQLSPNGRIETEEAVAEKDLPIPRVK